MPILNEETMYQAICVRDARFDERFAYGVVTTGVFCKASCSARTPRADNVRYFANNGEAMAAGFRACKRCRPLNDEHADVIRVARHIDHHVEDKLLLDELAELVDLSSSHLQKKFKAVFGLSPRRYHALARVKQLKTELRETAKVSEAIYAAGYGSASRVYDQTDEALGMTPAQYQAGGQGERIWYAVRESVFGLLMTGATTKGICFVQFGPDTATLKKQLADEFPNAELQPSGATDSPLLDDWMVAIDESLRSATALPELPLDLRGTAFQLRVWNFLLSVREGDVISYSELAAAVNKPKAVRAAASACARNRVALLVPCHRVLRSDGSLGGYRWGLEMKQRLLAQERSAVAGER